MLSGHTHEGQIWPFRYLVHFTHPFLAGRYEVEWNVDHCLSWYWHLGTSHALVEPGRNRTHHLAQSASKPAIAKAQKVTETLAFYRSPTGSNRSSKKKADSSVRLPNPDLR